MERREEAGLKTSLCREQFKIKSDMSYNLTDSETLDTVLSRLMVIATIVERNMDKTDNLPVHTGTTVNMKTESYASTKKN